MPLYVATDWQRPERVHALLRTPSLKASVMRTPAREWEATSDEALTILWADVVLLAMARCRVINPVSTFARTIELLRTVWRLKEPGGAAARELRGTE